MANHIPLVIELKTYFHYPGQRFSSYYTAKEDWDVIRPDTLTYSKSFRLSDIQVIKYCNKRSAPCVRDWRGHDQYVMDKMMLEVGCRPPQWNTTKNLPLCSTQRQMKKYQKFLNSYLCFSFSLGTYSGGGL